MPTNLGTKSHIRGWTTVWPLHLHAVNTHTPSTQLLHFNNDEKRTITTEWPNVTIDSVNVNNLRLSYMTYSAVRRARCGMSHKSLLVIHSPFLPMLGYSIESDPDKKKKFIVRNASSGDHWFISVDNSDSYIKSAHSLEHVEHLSWKQLNIC